MFFILDFTKIKVCYSIRILHFYLTLLYKGWFRAFFFPFQASKSSKMRQLVDFIYFGKNSLIESARKTLDRRLHRQKKGSLSCALASLQNLNSLNIFNRILSNTISNKNRHKRSLSHWYAVGSYIISCIWKYQDKNPEHGTKFSIGKQREG